MNWSMIGKSVTGLNWYKWGAIALLAAALFAGGYGMGTYNKGIECEEAKTALAEKRTQRVIDFTKVQGSASTVAGDRARQIAAAVAVAKEALAEETSAKQELAECRISETRLKQLNALARETRRR